MSRRKSWIEELDFEEKMKLRKKKRHFKEDESNPHSKNKGFIED